MTKTLLVEGDNVGKAAEFDLKTILKKKNKLNSCYLFAVAYSEDGNILSMETLPLTNENKAKLPKANIDYNIKTRDSQVEIELSADSYARYVEIRLKGHNTMLSDNYFDMLAHQKKIVTFELPDGEDSQSILNKIEVRSLCDVQKKYTFARDRLTKLSIFLNPVNLANYVARTFDK